VRQLNGFIERMSFAPSAKNRDIFVVTKGTRFYYERTQPR
jgi:hypothetical protein